MASALLASAARLAWLVGALVMSGCLQKSSTAKPEIKELASLPIPTPACEDASRGQVGKSLALAEQATTAGDIAAAIVAGLSPDRIKFKRIEIRSEGPVWAVRSYDPGLYDGGVSFKIDKCSAEIKAFAIGEEL